MPQQLFNPAAHKKACSMVTSYILRRSGNADDVKDILQEGWSIFFQKAYDGNLDQDCPIAPYLYGICRILWKRELEHRKGQILSDTFEDIEDSSDCNTIEEDRKEVLLQILLRCIEKLSNKCQEVFRMKMEEYSCEEIAEQLELGNSQITRNKTYLCKKRLRELVLQDPEYIRVFRSN